jgi:hypothetical protein
VFVRELSVLTLSSSHSVQGFWEPVANISTGVTTPVFFRSCPAKCFALVKNCTSLRRSHLGPMTRFLFLSDSCWFVTVGRPLWRQDGSVVYNCCCISPAVSSPAGLTTIIYCLIRDSPILEGQIPVFISPRDRVNRLYPRLNQSQSYITTDGQSASLVWDSLPICLIFWRIPMRSCKNCVRYFRLVAVHPHVTFWRCLNEFCSCGIQFAYSVTRSNRHQLMVCFNVRFLLGVRAIYKARLGACRKSWLAVPAWGHTRGSRELAPLVFRLGSIFNGPVTFTHSFL